jgi:hypothetical protein
MYLIGGLLVVMVGFVTKQDFFLSMGVIVVLLGSIVSLSLKVSHLIHLIKEAGLWDPNMPQKKKKHKPVEKSASELLDIERRKAEEKE